MDAINEFLVETLGPMGPLIAVGILGVLLILVALPAVFFRRRDPLDRLKDSLRSESEAASKPEGLRVSGKDDRLDRFKKYLEPTDLEELGATRMQLIRAGYRSKGAVQTFHFAQFALGIGFLALGILYTLIARGLPMHYVILAILLPGGIGYYLPKYWVTRRIQKRQEEIEGGFPDSLDLMLVCVEAGQSLDQAINRVSKEIYASYPAIGEEFETVAHEMKAGKDKHKVLRDFGERCDVQDINSFVTVLIQSATFGTSIAEALRVYAEEMRDKRVMKAEEKANKLPTKLTLGTMMFCVPPLLVILIGPSIYDIAQTLGGGTP